MGLLSSAPVDALLSIFGAARRSPPFHHLCDRHNRQPAWPARGPDSGSGFGGSMLHGHIRHTTVALPIRRGPV